MRGGFAKALFAVALLANLLIGLPGKVLAQSHHPAEITSQTPASHDDHHQHMVHAPEPACPMVHESHDAAPGDTSSEDCCHLGLGSPVLSDGIATALIHWDHHDHGLPVSDQILASGNILPPLRPPRA
mgnify:FL=1